MKNITLTPILLPTEDASRLHIEQNGSLEYYGNSLPSLEANPQHLYLCSTLPIPDVHYTRQYPNISTYKRKYYLHNDSKVIGEILFTTDPKLIADGVPAIDGNTKAESVDYLKGYKVNFLEEYCKCYKQNDKISERKTIEQCKDEVAIKHRFSKWMYLPQAIQLSLIDKACELYAKQKDNQKGVDVEKLAENVISFNIAGEKKEFISWDICKEALQSNAGGFSLEQARQIWNYAGNFFDEKGERMNFDSFIQSLTKEQPKGDIIIECEMEYDSNLLDVYNQCDGLPKRIKLDSKGQPTLIFK